MDQKARGEPLGCLAFLVGLAALVLGASATAPGRRLLSSLAPWLAGPPSTGAADVAPVAGQRQSLAAEIEALRGGSAGARARNAWPRARSGCS